MENDLKYVKELSEGNREAFDILFLRYQPRLVNFLSGFLHDEETAHDMAQDIFFKIWQGHSSLRNVRSFSSYLFRMAHNAICNFFNHSLVSEKYTLEMLFKPLETENPEEKYFADELQSLIELKVDQMPAKRREIFRMSRIEGLSNSEIAKKLNISQRTVENHLSTSLRELREMLSSFIAFFV